MQSICCLYYFMLWFVYFLITCFIKYSVYLLRKNTLAFTFKKGFLATGLRCYIHCEVALINKDPAEINIFIFI